MSTTLSQPDNYPTDWYGYATNQMGHMVVGLVLYIWLQAGSFYVIGEFSYRWHVLLVIAVGYMAWEVIMNGKAADSVEDWLFVTGYGAGIPALTFVEAQRGVPSVLADFEMLFASSVWVAAHILWGVYCRIRNERFAKK